MTGFSNRTIRAVSFFAVLAGIILVAVLTASQAAKNIFTSPSERYRQEGDAFATDQRIPEAVLAYRQAVEADPNNQKAIQDLSSVYQSQGRLRTASRYRLHLPAVHGTQSPTQSVPVRSADGWSPAWTATLSESAPAGGTIQGDYVIVAYEDGTVAALQAADGSTVWKTRLDSPATSAPAANQADVWVGAYDGALYKLSLKDGKRVWKHETGGPIYAPPMVTEDLILCPSGDGTLHALRNDGSELWSFRTSGQLHSAPAVSGNRVFFGSLDGYLYAVSLSTGIPLWPGGILTGGAVESQPVVANDRVIFGSGDGRVYALAPLTGGQYWRYSTPDAVYTVPLVVENTVYIASSGGTLSAVDFLTGKRIWQTTFNSMLRNPPVLAGGRLFLIADADPNLYVVDPANGKVLQAIPTGDWTSAGPWVAGDQVILVGKDGTILAYRLAR